MENIKKPTKIELKEEAKLLWRRGFKADEIRIALGLRNPLRQVFQWIDDWKKESFDVEQSIWMADKRLTELTLLPIKNALQLKEMDILSRLIEKEAANQRSVQAKQEKKLEIAEKKEAKAVKAKNKKNSIDHITEADFEKFEKTLFWHQLVSLKAAFDEKLNLIRMILKPRQAGQTYVESYIAFKRAVLLGHTHNFLSATIPQAMVFRRYINDIATKHFGCEELFGGRRVQLVKDGKNWGSFEFISSRIANAQGRPGHVIFDECAWTLKFSEVDDVANAMATQNGYTVTYLTTPSTIMHSFYDYWTGERVNKYRMAHEKIDIDVRFSSFEKLDGYRLDGDGVSRFMYTVDKAIDKGFTLVSIDKLKLKTPNPIVFDNLYRCQFIDDSESVFTIKSLLRCAVADADWEKYDRKKYVGVGYDPSSGSELSGDEAGIGFIELPDNSEKEPFRLLEFQNFDSGLAKSHVDFFKARSRFYKVKKFYCDKSGSGVYVWQHVKSEVKNAIAADFSMDGKTFMVLKMQDLIREKRFLFHEDLKHEVIASFMSIKRGFTARTNMISYYSTRTKGEGTGVKHGELFWTAAMVCAGHERLNYQHSNDFEFFSS